MEPIIHITALHHTYQPDSPHPLQALRGVDLTIYKGEYVAIIGHNGSGKSTLAKHLNALLLPTEGDVWIKEWNTRDLTNVRKVRSTVGMVFQTPDNQIVATIVEEDVAFGPENLGVPHDDMVRRVDWSLEQVGMLPFRKRAPHLLSGGQKQRVCIAGVLAMQTEVLVLDESTAMLDPLGRQEVLETTHRLNREQGVTVVAITHFMREAINADRVIIMEEGRIVLEGTPRELFSQVERLRTLQLDVPQVTELACLLQRRFPSFPVDILSVDEMIDALKQHGLTYGNVKDTKGNVPGVAHDTIPIHKGEPLIATHHLAHDYMRGTPLQVRAIDDINIEVYPGEIVGIIGHTGSGKSTAIQHFNALLRPHGGSVMVLGQDLSDNKVDVRAIRRQVGLVFQFPEAQLFERYVGDDVAYGPRNLNLSREEVRARVRRAMESVGLGFEEFKDRLTFAISGGQRRRVALAGVLALEPGVLVLDEPTAGLDPQGRHQLLDHILGLHREHKLTLVMISHNMEELAEICDRLYVIAGGRTVMDGTPAHIFGQASALRQLGLDVPAVTMLMSRLEDEHLLAPGPTVYTVEEAGATLVERMKDEG